MLIFERSAVGVGCGVVCVKNARAGGTVAACVKMAAKVAGHAWTAMDASYYPTTVYAEGKNMAAVARALQLRDCPITLLGKTRNTSLSALNTLQSGDTIS